MRPRVLLPLAVLLLVAVVAVPAALGAYAKAPAYLAGTSFNQFSVGVAPDGNHVASISVSCGNAKGSKNAQVVFKNPHRIGPGGRLSFVGKAKAYVGMTPAGMSITKTVTLRAKLHFLSKTTLLARTATSVCFKGKAHNWRAHHINGG